MKQVQLKLTAVKGNPLNKLVRDCLTQALLQLMEQKPYSQITVSEIVQKAGVARVSFYRNYGSKEAILYRCIEEIFYQIDFSGLQVDSKEQQQTLHRNSFETVLKYRSFFKLLHQNDLLYLIYNSLLQNTPLHITTTGNYLCEIQPPFFAGATYGVICHWISTDFSQSPEVISRDFTDLVYQHFLSR